MLKEKKDKLKNLFENSDNSKGMFSLNQSESSKSIMMPSKRSKASKFDSMKSNQVEEIKEEMNDDDVREGMNFHYKADINIKNDKL